MTGDAFLQIAGKIVATYPHNEAACRSAISRAYYGAFHIGNALLRELGFTDAGHDHGKVAQHLIESRQQQAVQAGQELNSLYTYRRRADYDLSDSRHGSAELARLCVERAARFVQLLKEYDDPQLKASLQLAVSAYRSKLRPN